MSSTNTRHKKILLAILEDTQDVNICFRQYRQLQIPESSGNPCQQPTKTIQTSN